jgi:hypothetical protein
MTAAMMFSRTKEKIDLRGGAPLRRSSSNGLQSNYPDLPALRPQQRAVGRADAAAADKKPRSFWQKI